MRASKIFASVVAAAAFGHAALAADPTLSVAQSEQYGEYLVGPEGKPVYMFTTDTQGGDGTEPAISCTSEACLQAWPLVTASGEPTAGDQVDAELLGTMSYEGETVVTYNGWPLYNYAPDEAGGEPTGQDIHSFGGEWYL